MSIRERPHCQKGGRVVRQEGADADKEKIVAYKCDLCAGRSGGPACVEACPASAFVVVDPAELKKSIKSRRTAAALEMAFMKK